MSAWDQFLVPKTTRVLPWVGGRTVCGAMRVWRTAGPLPVEHGWFAFEVDGGRVATFVEPAVPDHFAPDRERYEVLQGYLAGERLIPDNARVVADPEKLVAQTMPVHLVEPGLDRFARASVACLPSGVLVYLWQELPHGPEGDALLAYQDRKADLDGVPGVTPALDLAFRWLSYQRDVVERRTAERQRVLEEERRREEAMRSVGTAVGRRALAPHDFTTAAKAALALAGAEWLDDRQGHRRSERVVQFRFRRRRFECVVDALTLQVVDSGICLSDHDGTKGDTWLTLESLSSVIGEAVDTGRLVVYRHVDDEGDEGDDA